MSHDTDGRGTLPMVAACKRKLVAKLRALGQSEQARVCEESVAVELVLERCVVATRRNDPLNGALHQLGHVLGLGSTDALRESVLELQDEARKPIDYGFTDDDLTPAIGQPVAVNARESLPRGVKGSR